jgi:hypothetical protein
MPRWEVVTPWYAALDLPGAQQMKFLKNLMLSRPFLTRIPDQSALIAPRADDLTRIQITRDGSRGQNDASYLLAYLPSPTSATIDTSKIGGRKLRGWWFNPRDGQATALGMMENEGKHSFTPPDGAEPHDWVLVLDDESKQFPPPGSLR